MLYGRSNSVEYSIQRTGINCTLSRLEGRSRSYMRLLSGFVLQRRLSLASTDGISERSGWPQFQMPPSSEFSRPHEACTIIIHKYHKAAS